MKGVRQAQPIRPYDSPMSVVWTRGEGCTEADCRLLTTALSEGDVEVVEYGRWGEYNVILRWSRSEGRPLYFLAELVDTAPDAPC